MRYRSIGLSSIALGLVAAVGTAACAFEFWEATLYEARPAGLGCGIPRALVLYEGQIAARWSEGNLTFDRAALTRLLEAGDRDGSSALVIVDIESVPLSHVDALGAVIRFVKESNGSRNVGVYDIVPKLGYWEVIRDKNERGRLSEREEKASANLARDLDILFPSLYAAYDDVESWARYAQAKIGAARALQKPVIPFIWPQYHDSNASLGRSFLPAAHWQRVLDVVFANADGAVIWGGWRDRRGERLQWDPAAQWWTVTKNFIASRRLPYNCRS